MLFYDQYNPYCFGAYETLTLGQPSYGNYECGFGVDAPSFGNYECGFSADAPSFGEYECLCDYDISDY